MSELNIGVVLGTHMPLDSAGEAMIALQVRHHHNRLKLITSIKFNSWVSLNDSGWLTLDAR